MNLRVTRVREERSTLVGPPCGRHIARHCVGREEECVSVTASCEYNCVSGVRRQFARHEIADHDACGASLNHHDVNEFTAVEETDTSLADLASELLISTEQQLLTGLATGIEGAAHLSPTERTVVEHAAVFTSERDTLSNHLVDDVDRHFSQTVHV